MKLLILTQKVDRDDDVLGFFHRWIEEFAVHCEKVTVVCLQKGVCALPANVAVYSLGKEHGASRLRYLARFFLLIVRERKSYQAVFVHMNPIYVLLGGWYWRLQKKKVALWYTHKHVDGKLRLAEKLVQRIFTASQKSFRLPSDKVIVTGHGIDTAFFHPELRESQAVLQLVTIGRLSPIKDYETLLAGVALLRLEGVPFHLTIIGEAVRSEDRAYVRRLKRFVEEKQLQQVVTFAGALPHVTLPKALIRADVFINLSRTGSVDKAVLEAMSCAIPVITSNEAFREVLGGDEAHLVIPPGDAQALAQRLQWLAKLSLEERRVLGERLRTIVCEHHALTRLIPFILRVYDAIR